MTSASSAVGHARDGYLDRLLLRRVSRPLSAAAHAAGVPPNLISIVSMGLGVWGGLLLAAASPGRVAVGALALLASAVLDCVDGEVARLGGRTSGLGHGLDVAADTIVGVAVLVGIARRVALTGSPHPAVLGALAVGVAASFAAITWSDVTDDRQHHECWEHRVVAGVLAPLTTRDLYVFPIAFALAGRLDLLLVGAAVGSQAFWMGVVVLTARSLAAKPRA